MITNQTIDGVPRALLQSLYTDTVQQWGLGGNAAGKLRALLEREVITDDHLRQRIAFLTSEVHARAEERDSALHELQELKAAQPQSEPVEYQSRTRPLWRAEDGERAWFPWEKCSAESFANYRKNPLIHDWQYEVRALYAEQPAPVVVAQIAGFNVVEDSSIPPGQIRMCNCNQGRLPCTCKPTAYDGFDNGVD